MRVFAIASKGQASEASSPSLAGPDVRTSGLFLCFRMSERKERRREWWKKHLDEKEELEYKEDVIAASNRRKQQLSGKSVSTRKRKRPIEDTTSIDIPCDTDQLKDQIDSQRKQKNKRNLPYDATSETLTKHFSKAGDVDAVRLLTNKDSGLSRGCAFVEFSNSGSYMNALQLHHSLLGDRKINVEATCGGGGRSKHRKKKLAERQQKWKCRIRRQIDQKKQTKAKKPVVDPDN